MLINNINLSILNTYEFFVSNSIVTLTPKFQPLSQFELLFLDYYKDAIPVSNAFIYMLFIYLSIRFLFGMIFINLKVIPNTWQNFLENMYLFVFGLLKQQVGVKGYGYFPLKFTLFLFILFANILGMTLYSFTVTSHGIITFSLAFIFFIGIVIIGIVTQKIKFLNTFIPSGSPLYLLPFMVVIEIISYLSRPFSLAIRLFANMMSGHTLLAILANFTFVLSKKNLLIAFIPFVLIVGIIGLEAMIAILQAYVFTVLLCIYLKDSIHGAH